MKHISDKISSRLRLSGSNFLNSYVYFYIVYKHIKWSFKITGSDWSEGGGVKRGQGDLNTWNLVERRNLDLPLDMFFSRKRNFVFIIIFTFQIDCNVTMNNIIQDSQSRFRAISKPALKVFIW